ncbi:hypothetical protein MNV49_006477 [Pseudohyphozyma bogoriensis]|nr:hypothetical protein MNV49_006477 [Pseudohyphozyma bogoriensis]
MASTRPSSTMTQTSGIELEDLSRTTSYLDRSNTAINDSTGVATEALPPVDTGKAAWSFLAAATMIETILWGLPFSVGVLQSYWSTTLFPPGTPGTSLLSTAAVLQTGLMYMGAVVFGRMFARFPHQRVKLQYASLVLSSCGLLGSAFVTKPWHLVVTLGLLYPCGAAFYLPAVTLLFEWFAARRGLASGIMFAGTGAGGSIFPFVIQGLLNKFGYKATMLSVAVGFFILGAISLYYIRPRVPPPPAGTAAARQARKVNFSFMKRSTLWAFSGAIMFSSLGNFIPSVWLPTYALDVSLTENDGTLLVSVMNAASVVGLLFLGWLSDKVPIRYVITLSCGGSALSCLFLWGFGKTLQPLVVFCIVFGALGLGFSAVWSKLISIIAKDDPLLPSVIFPIFAFSRGIANVSSGPVSEALLKTNSFKGAMGGYGVGNYGALLLYSGLTMLLGSVVGVIFWDKPTTEARNEE